MIQSSCSGYFGNFRGDERLILAGKTWNMSLGDEETWVCVHCTYENKNSTNPRCEICGKLRPRSGRSKVEERCDTKELSYPAKKRMRPCLKRKKKLFHRSEPITTPVKQTASRCTPLSNQPSPNVKRYARKTPSREKSSESGDKIDAHEVNHQMQIQMQTEVENANMCKTALIVRWKLPYVSCAHACQNMACS